MPNHVDEYARGMKLIEINETYQIASEDRKYRHKFWQLNRLFSVKAETWQTTEPDRLRRQGQNHFFKLQTSRKVLHRRNLVNMGRLHSKGKGISASAIPYSRQVPTWFKSTPETVVDNICKLARKGATPSQIGVVLRDSHGVAQVKVVTGNKILRILKSNGMRNSSTFV